jgi:hypothetical protein
MNSNQKLLILCLIFLISILPSCLDTVHQTTSTQPRMSIEEATTILKKAVKDSITDINVKAVRDVIVYEDGFTLINFDNTKKHHYFKDIADPIVMDWMKSSEYLVKFIEPLYFSLDYVKFGPNLESANAFANALYYVKHTDIKQEREKEREDSLRRVQQTAIDEQKEREKKQEESLRLIQKTTIKEESGATSEETIPDATTKRRKSQSRPTPPRKSGDEALQRPQEGGPPPLPALPPGGAVSGH